MNNKLFQVLNENTTIDRLIRMYNVSIEEYGERKVLRINKPIPVPNFIFVRKVMGRLTKIDDVIVGDGDYGAYE